MGNQKIENQKMGNLKIGRLVLGMGQTNCYFIYRDSKDEIREVIIIDPAEKGKYIFETLTENGFQVAGILLTHAHFDHILGANELRELSGADLYAYEGEKEMCEDARINMTALFGKPYTLTVDEYRKDGDIITIAGMSCRLIATPGHTKGSCCYYFEEDKILISGDTLFLESVGRTDFPGGSMSSLVRNVKEKLFVLPDDGKVYPGHGESTDIGHEKKHNPFCR